MPTDEPFATEAGAAMEAGAATAHLPEGPPSRAWRLLDRVVLTCALLGILVPGGMLAAGFEARPIENRPLATVPPLTAGGLDDASWFAGVDRYLADNLWVRRYAVRLRGEAYLLSGGTGNRDVIRGRGGWLFPRGSFVPLCRTTGSGLAAGFADAAAVLAARGVALRVLIVPDKHTIYPERVGPQPFPPSCSELGRADLRAGIAALGAAGIDAWSALEVAKAANPTEPLYYASDDHWTPFGALQALRPLIASLDPAAWSDSEVVIDGTRRRVTNLARQVGVIRIERTVDVRLRPGIESTRVAVPVPVELRNAPSVFRTTVEGDMATIRGRTLIVCDSAFRIDLDMLTPYFEDATWVHPGDLGRHPELVSILGPFDTVVMERVERFLYADDLDAIVRGLADLD